MLSARGSGEHAGSHESDLDRERQATLLKRQIILTDCFTQLRKDMVVEVMGKLISEKQWHCKIILRTLLIINRHSEKAGRDHQDLYF